MTAKRGAIGGERGSFVGGSVLDNFIREMDAEGTPIPYPDWILSSNETRHYTHLDLAAERGKRGDPEHRDVGRRRDDLSLAQNEKLADIAIRYNNALWLSMAIR
jgi:hypothetical protein